MTDFFTSDTHFGHANVIKYSNRPYASKEEMDEKMIANWNSVVKPTDRVFHLGDFSFASENRTMTILDQLVGEKHLIFGNHDKSLRKSKGVQQRFVWCRDYHEMYGQVDGEDIKLVLCHYPMITWNKSGRGSYMLHGHCHGNLTYPYKARIIDVGVDPQGYFPMSFAQVHAKLKDRNIIKVDHHGEEM